MSPLERDWSTKPIIYIINNSFALRYVTSQIWKYYGIFGFVPNERGRIHEHKAAFRKQLSAQVFKVYVSVYVRDAFRITTWFSSHPMRDWIAPSAGRPSVSLIYNKIIDCITKPLSIKTIWNRELSDLNLSVDWERVWSNLSLTSKNLAHRLIHFQIIHRAYITPYKIFKIKLQSNLNCHICNTASSGTFLHMFWECPVVISLWTHVNLVLSSLLRIDWSVNPSLCLLNDDSGLCISSMQKRMLFAGFIAVKKTIIQNWFTPHMCRKTYWIRSLLQIVTCECTTARVGGARPSTIDAWQCFLVDIRDCIKEWLFVFWLSFPLSLPFDWTLKCWVYVCCFVLLCSGCYVVLCVKKKKNCW